MPLLTRITHRLKDAREEYTERIQDSKSGHRDKYGRKTHLWHEREYERERRRRKREHNRKEKGMADGERKKIEAVMSGAIPKDDGDVALVEVAGEYRGTPTIERNEGSGEHGVAHEGVAGSSRISRFSTGYQRESRSGGGSGPRDVSPMPSEHSISSVQAQVHRRRTEERARARAEGRGEAPNDSEDEEEEKSDEGSSDEEDEAAKAAKQTREPAVGGAPPSASGLRGGGGGGVAEPDDGDSHEDEYYSFGEEEYNEHEDFDDEYFEVGSQRTVRLPPSPNDEEGKDIHNEQEVHESPGGEQTGPELTSTSTFEEDDKNHQQPDLNRVSARPKSSTSAKDTSDSKPDEHDHENENFNETPQNCEVRPSSTPSNGEEPKANIASQSSGKLPNRTPRPYTLANVHDTLKLIRPLEVSCESGERIQKSDGNGKGQSPQQQEETPRPKLRVKKAPKPAEEFPYENCERAQERPADPKKAPKPTKKAPCEDWERAPGKAAGPQKKAAHTYEDYASDDCRPGAKFPEPMPQAHPPYRGDHYSSYWSYSHHKGPPYGAQYASPFGEYGGGNAYRGRYGDQSAYGSYEGRRIPKNDFNSDGEPDERQKPRRRRVSESESSTEESFSDEDRQAPSARQRNNEARERINDARERINDARKRNTDARERRGRQRRQPGRDTTPSPPPRQSTRRAAGKQPAKDKSPPPKYHSVDSVKEAPPNYYALLGVQPNATPKEIERASKKARVQAHTDQVLKLGHNKTEEEVTKIKARAGRVGQAAEILKDPVQRAEYDIEVRNWKRKYGGVLPAEEEE
ncbi:MAG: hypothetical protein Q9188_001527 [Gyalolechia gomerana]